jgi:ABC-type phosphate transport system substrate-binding protein
MKKARLILLCCMGICLCLHAAHAAHQVVLVTASDSPLSELDSLQLRKIYLGFGVKSDGRAITAYRNTADEALNRIFLQTVVAMSEKAYTRRQLSLVLRKGVPRVAEFDDPEKLLAALKKNPYSISYMWKEDAISSSEVKILRVLWDK